MQKGLKFMFCRDTWQRVAASGAWFAGLPATFADALLARAEPVSISAGQRLFARGEVPDGLYCVLSGVVRVTATSVSGQEALLAMLQPPQWFGEIAVFDGAPRTHDAWAQEDCELLRVPQAALLAELAERPQHWRELGQLLTQKLRITFAAVEELSLLRPTQRVAGRLLLMADGYGTWTDRSKRVLEVSQEQLGLMLALSRQTVNQSLRELQSRGCIKRRRASIEVIDVHLLRATRDGI
ncbi:Crp/Fnr family transcriptional regulator [Vandammella animalimorsus]|nr:Crp/Fnr family transcriptional regulator [Vandammella animalimorsus]